LIPQVIGNTKYESSTFTFHLSINQEHSTMSGGKYGSESLRYRATTSAAVSRLRSALPSSVSFLGFELQDNSNFKTVKSKVYNPLSQDELIAKINAEEASGDLALSIISTWYLKDLSGVSVTVCDQIKGLVLFGNRNLSTEAITAFLARCPNLEALMLASDVEASFVQSIFQASSFPKLRFLEVSKASDYAIAAMASAPNLQKLIVRAHDSNLTNKGFGCLVAAGGGKALQAITVKIANKYGPLCKTVSKFYLMATLPVFCAGNGKESDLQQMIWGKQMQTQASADSKTRLLAASKPFAAVPIALMTFAQLMAALENRGIVMPAPRTTDIFRQALIDYGFTLEEEAAIQARKKAKAQSGSKPKSVSLKQPSVKKPFAVIPVELMTFTQLIAALESRGVDIPNPRSTDNFRQALFDCGFTLEEEAAIQARNKARGSKLDSRKQAPATKPFAVVPVEFMSFAQLIAALANRGVDIPNPRSTDNFRQALFDCGFTLEEEAAIQARKKAESECKPASLKRPLTDNSVANASKAQNP
jgi:hypothetical protein